MKKIITITCLVAFASIAIAQEKAGQRNAYVDPTSEFEYNAKIEEESLTTQTIIVPDGFVEFYDKKAEAVLAWEYTDKDGSVQSGTDGKYKYMSKSLVDGGGSIKIEYSPLYQEVRIYYTCAYSAYDRGEAMNTVMSVLQDFTILKEFENQDGDTIEKSRYYNYKYMAGGDKDGLATKERSYRNGKLKFTEYSAYVKFVK